MEGGTNASAGRGPWAILEESLVYERFGRGLVEVTFVHPSGRPKTFSIRTERPSVVIVPLTVKGEIVIARQYRPGPRKMFDELPGGYLEDRENVDDGAHRELLEETGYDGDLQVVGMAHPDPYGNAVKYCVVGRNVAKKGLPSLNEEETVEVRLCALHYFREMLRSGSLTDVDMGYMGLDFLGLL
jgi:ADP-ribose pyrophosphatase